MARGFRKGQSPRRTSSTRDSRCGANWTARSSRRSRSKTSGVYVPVGTRAYDLGELYAKYLQGRRGSEEQSGKRIRPADQFQVFLAMALLALLADAFLRPYRRAGASLEAGLDSRAGARGNAGARVRPPALPVSTALVLFASLAWNRPGRQSGGSGSRRIALVWPG